MNVGNDLDRLERENVEFENEQELEERRKNRDFIQVYKSQIKYLRKLTSKDPAATEIFLFLMEHMNKSNAVVCSYKVFEEALGLSKSTVYRAVKTLKETNHVEIHKVGSANIYHLNSNLVWSSWATGKKYAEAKGKILFAESEQDKASITKEQKNLIPIISLKETE